MSRSQCAGNCDSGSGAQLQSIQQLRLLMMLLCSEQKINSSERGTANLDMMEGTMLATAEEFVRLRSSTKPAEYRRAVYEQAPEMVWRDIIIHYPEMRVWVAQNKTVPIAILELLSRDRDSQVRTMVAMKRKRREPLQLRLLHDSVSGVRYHVACNSKATCTVLQLLAGDREGCIAEKAQQRLATERCP